MPRRDGTGPAGQGAKTGRGLGLCSQPGSSSLQTPQKTSNWFARLLNGTMKSFEAISIRQNGGRNASGGRGQRIGRRGIF